MADINIFDQRQWWDAARQFVSDMGVEPIDVGEPADEAWPKIKQAMALAGSPIGFGMDEATVRSAVTTMLGLVVGVVQYSADFTTAEYSKRGETAVVGDLLSVSRDGTNGKAAAVDGTYSSFAADTPRITDAGLLLETAASNGVTNCDFAGAAIGIPGTPPTGAAAPFRSNCTQEITAVGTNSFGLPYIQIKWTTSASLAGSFNFKWDAAATSPLAVVQGDTVCQSMWMTLMSGTMAGLTTFGMDVIQRSASADLGAISGANLKAVIDGVRQRIERTYTIAHASTTNARGQISGSFPSAASFSFEVRFEAPQLEKASIASSPFKGQRAADMATVKLPAGAARDLTISIDGQADQVISAVPSGDYVIDPATLSGPLVTNIVWGSV